MCCAVASILAGAVFRLLRERARDAGVADGRGGGVIVIQRFGGALNLNVHFHALILDGVFASAPDGRLHFHPLARLTTLDVEEVLATIDPLVLRRLERRGLAGGDETGGASDVWADEAPILSGLAAASIQGAPALAAPPARFGMAPPWMEPREPGPCHARANGFSLHAALVVPTGQRARLERVCRYVLRPPVATERLRLRLIALIDQAAIIARVLSHLDVPSEIPPPRPARPPPEMVRLDATEGRDEVVVP
jgi:hypothetical protein